ncbi:MAG: hypothetical protein RLZZ214_309 [Verrucomicrobiota bacterium]|jgi:HPt (histidine-containing phosphotransfer) domain-containing protein
MSLEKFLNQDLTSVATEFTKDCERAIHAMSLASASDDPIQVRQIAHQMLGASHTLGMLQLAEAFAIAENESHSDGFLDGGWFKATRRLLEAACHSIAKRGS